MPTMSPFKKTFQTLPTAFLPLTSEPSKPFVIENVSPTSSPTLVPMAVSSLVDSKGRSMSIVELK
ncbi:uncharacterized protein KQ657_004922 [Scheffersomyces spartinae]|uniref:Uncharacterized protein n=1 Tax=Scheffersomyces spartinae TaxID=45513 RepID=A0A9P7VAH6_9ASCO|nr:uncharacterized protein KQ657_004922 [Scheffersomyces spartinae]KAG7194210.1 hypothetical protein KQ657_004922 [Scheffersomyces spartinae]